MHRPRPARWGLTLATVSGLVLAGLGAPAAGEEHPGTPPAVSPDNPSDGPATASVVTLVTGDRVLVGERPDGGRSVTVDPAPRDGTPVSFHQYGVDDDFYVIPSDAATLIPEKLDRELFNVAKLAEHGHLDTTPVIMQRRDEAARTRSAAPAPGVTTTRELPALNASAAMVDGSHGWWEAVAGPAPGGDAGTGSPGGEAGTLRAGGALAGLDRVWLDEPVTATLDESVPQIGAPAAWQRDLDGSGVTVAVLDTGVDADHPDLAGRVADQQNFTDSGTLTDRHGHGTHVAGIVAGTGAASGGDYTGVAPGAEIISGKVLDRGGTGLTSWVLAGMHWAAPRADVVNMSLGSAPTDGSDLVSTTLNQLSAQHDTLFVTSAGNYGPSARSVGAPGSADEALTVGAVDKEDQLARRSSRGPRLGDWAVKPEITAPGVGIASARAEGTALGPVVDDHYTRIGGTSMAAPHVAAAAAILLQQDSTLTPDEVESALVGTAAPHDGLTVYQQGGGRVDLAAALDARVLAGPSPLNLGHFAYPHDDAEPVSAEISYTNRADEPLTLDLSLQAGRDNGAPVGEPTLAVQPDTLTVPPGGTTTATVNLDVPALDIGLYGGYLTAEVAGEIVTRTPVGFHKEDERYDIRIQGIDRDGNPAGGASFIGVLDVEDMTRYLRPGHQIINGQLIVRVPPGTYSVLGAIPTYDAHGVQTSNTFVGDPEVTVDGDVELTLDARQAEPITIETPKPEAEPQGGVSFGYWRSAERPGPIFNPTWLARHSSKGYYATGMDAVTKGEFEFHSRWRLAAPEAEMSVTEPVDLSLDPVLLRAPAVDGAQERRLVDVGDGTAADYEDVDVTGAVALARRGPVPFTEQEQHAAAAGAAALVVTNDVDGTMVGTLGEEGTIPALSLTRPEGEALRDLLTDSPVTVRLDGTVWSPYLYDLVLLETGGLPSSLSYSVARDDLAALEVDYFNRPGHTMVEGRHFARPFHGGSVYLHPPVEGPRSRTEYVVAGDGLAYQQTVYGDPPFEARLEEPGWTTYQAGDTVHKEWFRQVMRPATVPEAAVTAREGDTLDLHLSGWVDASGNYFNNNVLNVEPYEHDTVDTRVYRDGERIGESVLPRGSFPMSPGPAEYRVELDIDRDVDWWDRSTATRTAWTFTSQRPDDGSEVLPLLSVDYRAPLDLTNTAPHPRDRRGPSTLELHVRQQTDDLPEVEGARVWVSYDDGGRWQPRPVRDRGDGRFQVILPGRPASGGADAVSVRVEAWDADGNRIEQEIIRAWHLPTP